MSELRVVAAALRYADKVIHTLPPPARHHTLIRALSENYGRITDATEQGFILSDGQWASREQAYNVAKRSGQILGDDPNKRKLFSEDLW